MEKKPHCSGCCLLASLQGCSAGAVSCPALALSISSPCHVPSVFSPALRFLCLMSHLYILQVVCLAFISPISAFLEGWRGGAGGGCVSVLPTACFSPEQIPNCPNCRAKFPSVVLAFHEPSWLQEAPPEHQCSPASPSAHALGQAFFPASQSIPAPSPGGNQCGTERGPITWDTP